MSTEARSRLTLLVLSGDMEKGAAACNLALASLASGGEVTLFFSFWGINFLKRPGVPSAGGFLARGLAGLNRDNASVQRLGRFHLMGAGRWALSRLMRSRRVPSVHEGLVLAHGMGARFIACSTTLESMGLARESLIPEVDDVAGAAAFLEAAKDTTVITLS